MKPSPVCIEHIKSFEELRLKAYKPIPEEKNYTIGYGHCAADVKKGQLITLKQAEELLQKDIDTVCAQLTPFVPSLNQSQFDALVALVFNIGFYQFRYSTTGNLVRNLYLNCEPIDVARRIILWVRAGGKVQLGLQRRRVIEANMFLGYEAFRLEDGVIREYARYTKDEVPD